MNRPEASSVFGRMAVRRRLGGAGRDGVGRGVQVGDEVTVDDRSNSEPGEPEPPETGPVEEPRRLPLVDGEPGEPKPQETGPVRASWRWLAGATALAVGALARVGLEVLGDVRRRLVEGLAVVVLAGVGLVWLVGGSWRPGYVFSDCNGCPKLVVVPAGEFMMGSPVTEEGRYDNEEPRRRVAVSSFALGQYEVTRDEYRAFVEATEHPVKGCWIVNLDGDETFALGREDEYTSWREPGFEQGSAHPAVCVSWNDAQAYVRWLSRETGKSYRLPSESEWEYAARGATTARSYWGDASSSQCGYANGVDAAAKRVYSDWTGAACDDAAVYTAVVGSYSANAFSLFDMLGNVWEWAEDCWHENYKGAPSDGTAWRGDDCGHRVLRGGSWYRAPGRLRSASRDGIPADERSFDVGFRVARTLDLMQEFRTWVAQVL